MRELFCGGLLVLATLLSATYPAAAAPVHITIDARVLTTLNHMTFDIPGVTGPPGGFQAAAVQELDLEPGTYTLRAPAGGGGVSLAFSVSLPCVVTVAPGDTTTPAAPTNLRVQ